MKIQINLCNIDMNMKHKTKNIKPNKPKINLYFKIKTFPEPAPFSFKINWGLPPQTSTSSPSSILHQTPTFTTATSTSTENLSTITPNHARHSTDSTRDTAESCKCYFFFFVSFYSFS